MTTRPDPGRRVARLAILPMIVGPIVLAASWTILGIAANAQHVACWGGFNLTNIAGPLALDYRFYGNAGTALPLLTYIAQAIAAYAILYVAGRIALRFHATTICFAISVFGTVLVSLCFCVGYATSFSDLVNGGFLCGLGFELIPYGGLIAAVLAVVLGSLIGWLIQRQIDEASIR
jgi:hypothetical protein